MVALGILALIWGSSFLFIKVGVGVFPVPFFILLRTGISGIVLLVAQRGAGGGPAVPLRVWAILGLLNAALPYGLIAFGETRIDSGFAAVLNATVPLWVAAMSFGARIDDDLGRVQLAGIALGFVGVLLVMGPSFGRGPSQLAGAGAVLLASVMYAASGLYSRRRLLGVKPLRSSAAQNVASAIWLLPAVALTGGPSRLPNLAEIASLLALTLLGTALASVLYFRLLGGIGVARTSTVTYLIPVSALFWGWLLLGEQLKPIQLAGALVLLAGVFLATRPRRRDSVPIPA